MHDLFSFRYSFSNSRRETHNFNISKPPVAYKFGNSHINKSVKISIVSHCKTDGNMLKWFFKS
jgi:hypothetical protein